MTEDLWLAGTDTQSMLECIRYNTSRRKLRLLQLAIFHLAPFDVETHDTMWEMAKRYKWFRQTVNRYSLSAAGQLLETGNQITLSCHEAVTIVEEALDTQGLDTRFAEATDAGFSARYEAEQDMCGTRLGFRIACYIEEITAKAYPFINAIPFLHDIPHSERFLGTVSRLAREIFRNPFCPFPRDASWFSPTAVAIAQGIYDDKAFDRLPILADALQDAGCENDDILNHLRSDGPHVKGCWALDLVLGKA